MLYGLENREVLNWAWGFDSLTRRQHLMRHFLSTSKGKKLKLFSCIFGLHDWRPTMRLYANDKKFFRDANKIGLSYYQIKRIAESGIAWDDRVAKVLPVSATCKVCEKKVEYLNSKKNWRNKSKWSQCGRS